MLSFSSLDMTSLPMRLTSGMSTRPCFIANSNNTTDVTSFDIPYIFHQLVDHPDNISAHQHRCVAKNVILKSGFLTLLTPTHRSNCVWLVSRKDVDKDHMTSACYDLEKLGNISGL